MNKIISLIIFIIITFTPQILNIKFNKKILSIITILGFIIVIIINIIFSIIRYFSFIYEINKQINYLPNIIVLIIIFLIILLNSINIKLQNRKIIYLSIFITLCLTLFDLYIIILPLINKVIR